MSNLKLKIKKLRLEAAIVAKKINALEEQVISTEVIPELKEYVGRCFVYRDNTYGGQVIKANLWDVFRKVLEYVTDKDGYIHYIVEEFQIDRDGKCSLSVEDMYPYHQLGRHPFESYDEIDQEEYDVELSKLFSEMSLRTKIKKVLKEKK